MTVPSLFRYQNNTATATSADELNTLVQGCDNFNQLRAFGGAPGMQVYARGSVTPGDGGQGDFRWVQGQVADDNSSFLVIAKAFPAAYWQRMSSGSGRALLTQNTTLNWNPVTGNDTNSGSISQPFKTFVGLYEYCQKTFDLSSGFTLTANCTATGTMTDRMVLQGPLIGQQNESQFIIQGPGSASLTINITGASCIYANFNAAAQITGFNLVNTGSQAQVVVDEGSATINLGDITHGSAGVGAIQAANGAIRRIAAWSIGVGGTNLAYSYAAVSEVANALVDFGGWPVTFHNAPSFSLAYVNVGEASYADLGAAPSFIGTFTGPPWLIASYDQLGQGPTGWSALQACTTTPGVAKSLFDIVTTNITTVGALPSASPAGQHMFVSDANTTMALGIGTTVAAGGAHKVPVYSDGTNWIIG